MPSLLTYLPDLLAIGDTQTQANLEVLVMKLAILADIHGNLPALERVVADIESWTPDKVVVAGDVVNRGPRSRECLGLLMDKQRQDGWLFVRGNHEDYVLSHLEPDRPRSGPAYEIALNSLWTFQQLNGLIQILTQMPFQVSLPNAEHEEVRVVHASMAGNRDGIYPETTREELRQKIAPPPAVLVAGHTHRPLIRKLDETLIMNVGSVGMPFDGDDRAAYGRLTKRGDQWEGQIIRLSYDKTRAKQDFYKTGFIPNAGELARIMLVELQQARSHIFDWVNQYQPLVMTGRLSVGEAVKKYLAGIDQS